MVLTKNKFKAKGRVLHARRMLGVESHPGFHTTRDFNVACLYALARANDFEHEGSYGVHFVQEYPVVAVMDMRGLKKHIDYDADVSSREVLEIQLKEILKYHPDIQDLDDQEILDILYKESEEPYGDTTGLVDDSPLDHYSEHVYGYMQNPLRVVAEEQWMAGVIRQFSETKRIPEWLLMHITGQYRYLEDVSEERVVGVYYLRPLSSFLFDDDEPNELEEQRWPGFDCPYIYDVMEGYYKPSRTLVYGTDILDERQCDIFGYKQTVEYHGTIISLFREAAPTIGRDLPDPPCPPFKPENMDQKQYLNKVLEFRASQKDNQ